MHGWMCLACHCHAWLDVSVFKCLVPVTEDWVSLSCPCHAWLDVSSLSLSRMTGCISRFLSQSNRLLALSVLSLAVSRMSLCAPLSLSQPNVFIDRTLSLQGNQLFKEGKYEEAIECYTRGIQLDSSNALLPANRAMALLKQCK